MMDFEDLEAEELRCVEAGELDLALPSLPLYIVLHEQVIIRSAPNVEASMMGLKLRGDIFEVAACRGPWVRLALKDPSPEAWMLAVGDLAGLPGVNLLERIPEACEAVRRLELQIIQTLQLVQRRRLRWARKGTFGDPVRDSVHIGSLSTGLVARYDSAVEAHAWPASRWRVLAARAYGAGELVERCELIPLKCEMAFAQRGRPPSAFDRALLWQDREGLLSRALFPLGFLLLYRRASRAEDEDPALDARWSPDGEALLLRARRPVRQGEELRLPPDLREALSRAGSPADGAPPEPSRAGGPREAGPPRSGPGAGAAPPAGPGPGDVGPGPEGPDGGGQGAPGPALISSTTVGAVAAGQSTTHGRGVFALKGFAKNSVVEMCPTLEVGDFGREALIDFVMSFATREAPSRREDKHGGQECDDLTVTVAALGQGMVYNHRSEPNVAWSYMPGVGGGLVIITALQSIEQGEEMFIDYGQNYWAVPQDSHSPGMPSADGHAQHCSSLYYIVGTWNDHVPEPMERTGNWYSHRLTIGDSGLESFQILLRGCWASTLYPSVPDANPFVEHTLQGPDDHGHGRNWTIGKDARDQADSGVDFEICMPVDSRGAATAVTWRRHGADVPWVLPRMAIPEPDGWHAFGRAS